MSVATPAVDYSTITEVAGARGTPDQVERLCNRYYFAAKFCGGKDVLEVACGTGQGLGYLARRARSVVGVDVDDRNLETARAHYGDRIAIRKGDAEALSFEDASFDVIVLYEAIYYLPHPERFVAEARRLLRPAGVLIVGTANKDLPDFNPSPYAHHYHGPPELAALLGQVGFAVEIYGAAPVPPPSAKTLILRTAKTAVVRLGLMPKTMRGKELLKRFVFGGLVNLPEEVEDGMASETPPVLISAQRPDRQHRVLFAVARLSGAQVKP